MLLPFAENIEVFHELLVILLHAPKQCMLTSLCLTLRNLMDCSPPGSSVHEIFLARILKGVATLSSRGSSRPRDWTRVSCGSCIAGRFFTAEPPEKPLPKQLADPLCLGRMLASFVHFLWYSLTIITFFEDVFWCRPFLKSLSNLLQYSSSVLCFLAMRHVGVLAPRPGIKPTPSCIGRLSPNHWTAREVPKLSIPKRNTNLFTGEGCVFVD